jgi:HEAT repeat protein
MRRGLLILCAALAPLPVQAQSLADRVAAIRNEAVTFHFTARPGVCGDGETFVRTGRHSYYGSFSDEGYASAACVEGPVQVRLTIVDGVTRVQSWIGPLRSRNARDLGQVPAPEAAKYLVSLAQRGPYNASTKALMPAVLADSAVVWPALLAIARDVDNRPKATRQEAMLWLSRFASAASSGHPNDIFEDDGADDDDTDLKRHALFVLSQLPHGEGIPDLLSVARSNASPSVRSQALFWLGQSGDPRAITLFEAVLKGG